MKKAMALAPDDAVEDLFKNKKASQAVDDMEEDSSKKKKSRLDAVKGVKKFIAIQNRCSPERPFGVYVWSVITWSEADKDFQLSIAPFSSPSSTHPFSPSSPFDNTSSFYPDEIGNFNYPATVISNSKMYFISGCNNIYDNPGSRLVYSFDLDSSISSWVKHTDTNAPRMLHTVVSVGDYIYAFGSAEYGPTFAIEVPRTLHTWAERYHVKNDTWEYLPPPPQSLFEFDYTRAHAVCYNCPAFSYLSPDGGEHSVLANQNLVLFPLMVPDPIICVFNCDSKEWLSDIKPNFSGTPILRAYPTYLSDRLVVVDGVFIWHHKGIVHGYDLINKKYLSSLFIVPRNQLPRHHNTMSNLPPNDVEMYFSHQGDEDSLFLFFQIRPSMDFIHCYKFQIRKRTQGQDFLVIKKYKRLPTPSKDYLELRNLLVW